MTQKINEEDILNQVTNLILDKEIYEEERVLLLDFKKEAEKGRYFERELLSLAKNLQLLAIENLNEKKKLSPKINDFYLKIASYGQFEKNLARGLGANFWL